ncbi:Dolichyl-diphosphooligosaccharide--protein glycosyltransferase subunit STT3B [Taenia crassiceps]|uniref:dolichyl-diphosphooligosaccharide--protein glycotransferase n=1 Tax=Taenia crassiceps TaxID=6207 RepID=A0ABR4QAT7_9CEST
MVDNTFYDFLNWFDTTAWYPLGRIVGGTVYPGLMVTSGSIHYLLRSLNFPVHIREVCVFLAPIFSGLTAIMGYLLTKELWNDRAGLFSACFLAIVPGYISRSVAGSYDNEGIAIFALLLTYFLWLRAVRTGNLCWSVLCALAYLYMVSAWGGYVFIINLVPLHVFVLCLTGRYSTRLYVAYTSFYILGLILSMQVPFVGFQPIRTSEHMAAAGVFVLLQAVAFFKYLQSLAPSEKLRPLFTMAIIVVAGLVFLVVCGLTVAGIIAPWSGRFYSLWDTGYARVHIPIISSVSEHQPTTWTSFFFDLHVLVAVFPAGVWFCFAELDDLRVFAILYAIFASYFAGVMVRLILTLAPIVCVLAAIAFSRLYDVYLRDDAIAGEEGADLSSNENQVGKGVAHQREKQLYDKPLKTASDKHAHNVGGSVKNATDSFDSDSGGGDVLGISVRKVVVMVATFVLFLFVLHCTWVTSNAYSSPSVVLAYQGSQGERIILDDFREAYYWLWQNTPPDAKVMSWWDYGYQIAGMANRTTLVDNNTWNNSHIALVGMAMSSNETVAFRLMHSLDVDYVLIIFGGVSGYSGDDINKFLWMVRIAQGEHPKDIREQDYYTAQGEYRIDHQVPKAMFNSLMYKMSYYRFAEMRLDPRMPAGFDRARNTEIGVKNIELTHLEEAFTSEHWIVRVFRVKKPANRLRMTGSGRRRRTSRKTAYDRRGLSLYSGTVMISLLPLFLPQVNIVFCLSVSVCVFVELCVHGVALIKALFSMHSQRRAMCTSHTECLPPSLRYLSFYLKKDFKLNSSQEDLFFDQSKSLYPDTFCSSLLEVEREKCQPQCLSFFCHFPSSNLSVEVSISSQVTNHERRFLYELKSISYHEKVAFTVTKPYSVDFPLPFVALLLSTKLDAPTSNEYPISAAFMERVTGLTSHEVLIFGVADGSVFALPMAKSAKTKRIFHFPSSSPIFDLSMLYCVPSPELDIIDGDIDECLIAVTSGGLLACCYLNADRERRLAYFRLPPHFPPSRLSFTPFGSWLHILASDDGSLLSLSFSHTGGKELICTPAIYPHKPGRHVSPYALRDLDSTSGEASVVDLSIARSADELNRAPRWRRLNILEVVRLSGGQLGAVHRETGERLKLVDYISKYEKLETEMDTLGMQSVDKIRTEIIFHRLYRAIVEAVFKGPVSISPLLNTTVELRALEDLPGFCGSEHPLNSVLALVMKIAILAPVDIPSLPRDEWTDFKALSPSALLYLLLGDLGPFRTHFAAQLARLRDLLNVVTCVRPLGDATDCIHTNVEKWTAFSLVDHVRYATCALPASLFNSSSSFKVTISVHLELTSSHSLIPAPLRRDLYHQKHGVNAAIPRSHGFLQHEGNAQAFRYLAIHSEVEVFLEIQDTGFKITSSSLGAVWGLYEALQHYVKEFTKNESESALEMQLTGNQVSLEVKALLDIYAYIRNCKAFSLLTSLFKDNKSP